MATQIPGHTSQKITSREPRGKIVDYLQKEEWFPPDVILVSEAVGSRGTFLVHAITCFL